jgi:hypothetical protein
MSNKYWGQISKDLRQTWTAPTDAAAATRFAEFEQAWAQRYTAIIRLWRSAWEQFTPFLALPPESEDRLHDERDRVTELPVPAGLPPAGGSSPTSCPRSRSCTWSFAPRRRTGLT